MKYLFFLLALTSQAAFSQSVTIGAACVRYTTAGQCITQAEFEALDGASGNLQTQIDAIDTAASDVAANLATHEADTSTHGISSAIVGTTEVQTLTNKTLTAPAISSPTGLVKGDVGLGNVDNTSDANKPVSTATQTALDLKANLASPALTGNPTAPTQTAGNNSTRIATTAYVDGAIATEDALVVHKTGNESISGTKTFTGKLVASSTSNGATPCPVMTQAQRDAVSSPSNGDCVFNSTSNKLNVYNSTLSLWKEVSGSGGASNQILTNGDFEDGTGSWTLTAGSGSSETSTVLPPGIKSYKATLSAQTLALYQDVSTGAAQFNGTVQGVASCRVKASVSGVFVCSRTAGSTNLSNCAEVAAGAGWVNARAPFQLNGTSSGVAVVSGAQSGGTVTPGNITGDVYVDDCFVGMAPDFDQYPALTKTSTFTPTGAWNTNTTYAGKYRQEGNWFEFQYSISLSGAPNAANLVLNLPTGFVIDTNELSSSQSFSGVGGGDGVSGGNSVKFSVVYTSTTTVTVLAQQGLAANNHVQSFVSATAPYTFTSGDYLKLNFKVPIIGYSATVNTYTDQCASDLACANEYSVKVSSAGVLSDPSVAGFYGTPSSGGTGVWNIPVTGLTVTPNCQCNPAEDNRICSTVPAGMSSSNVRILTETTGAVDTNTPFTLTCWKQGVDYKARRQIVGTFANTPKIRGITTPTTYLVAFGGATVNTACTASPCTVHHNPSGIALTATRVSIGQFRVNFPNGTFTPNSYVYCFRNTISTQGESAGVVVADANGAAIYTINTRDAVGALQDSAAAVSCTGQ